MRRTRTATRWLTAALLGLAGCNTPEPNIKPPLREEYTIPPTDDPRFSQPPTFPKETLNQPINKELPGGPNAGFKGPGPRGSGGAGMGMGGGGY
jgi:hypothetical protein